VAAGLSNAEIAERHVYGIFMKLESTNRVSAIPRVRELGLLT
jgi:DNA-binding CsgD family transcriptional regulator